MSQSLSNILVHIIFSTKRREPMIAQEWEDELDRYLAGIFRARNCPAHKIAGMADHVHVVCSLSRTVTVSDLVEEVKKSSSKWAKTKGAGAAKFAWQNGYGAFSIGQSQLDAVVKYVATQKDHHRRRTFQEEFREFLMKYRIEFNERYVWD